MFIFKQKIKNIKNLNFFLKIHPSQFLIQFTIYQVHPQCAQTPFKKVVYFHLYIKKSIQYKYIIKFVTNSINMPLPQHHVFWKTPFEYVRDITLNHNDRANVQLAITRFDQAINRFDLPNDHTSGVQGQHAIVQAPFFQILKYCLHFKRNNMLLPQSFNKPHLQHHIMQLQHQPCPQRISNALIALGEEVQGQQFLVALQNRILGLIPQIAPNQQIPLNFNAMIDYRYRQVNGCNPINPYAQFNNLRTAILHLFEQFDQ